MESLNNRSFASVTKTVRSEATRLAALSSAVTLSLFLSVSATSATMFLPDSVVVEVVALRPFFLVGARLRLHFFSTTVVVYGTVSENLSHWRGDC